MPVPVCPNGQESSRNTDGAAGSEDGTLTLPLQHHTTLTPPHQQQHQQQQQQQGEVAAADPDVMAGYQDCLKETLRFLVEEERLPGDHPVVRGLVTHLTRQHAHVELTKLSQQIMADPVPAPASPLNAGYQVTLVEEDEDDETSDEEMSEYDELTESEDLDERDEVHEAFRRQLLRLVYQGCDLFAAPPPPPQPSLVLQL